MAKFKKFLAGVGALSLAAALASCGSKEAPEQSIFADLSSDNVSALKEIVDNEDLEITPKVRAEFTKTVDDIKTKAVSDLAAGNIDEVQAAVTTSAADGYLKKFAIKDVSFVTDITFDDAELKLTVQSGDSSTTRYTSTAYNYNIATVDSKVSAYEDQTMNFNGEEFGKTKVGFDAVANTKADVGNTVLEAVQNGTEVSFTSGLNDVYTVKGVDKEGKDYTYTITINDQNKFSKLEYQTEDGKETTSFTELTLEQAKNKADAARDTMYTIYYQDKFSSSDVKYDFFNQVMGELKDEVVKKMLKDSAKLEAFYETLTDEQKEAYDNEELTPEERGELLRNYLTSADVLRLIEEYQSQSKGSGHQSQP